MPISRREFERGRIDPISYVEDEIFRAYPDTAFTTDEILSISARQGRRISREELNQILAVLIQRGRIEIREMEGVIYYIYLKRPLGFRLR